jgi:DNA polymerase IV
VLRWLVLDLNSFFASCEQQENPELRGKPVIVVPTMAETTCAIAASYPAKAFGIKTGTLVHEARRLCPGVMLVQAHHKLYVDYHHRILEAIDRHIPVEEVMSIDEVACRLDRVQQDPIVARTLAQSIKRDIQTQVGECLTSSIGISTNKLLAKMASNMQKPDGLVILPIENLPGAILHLQIRAIPGIGPKMAEHLRRSGITDMAALWNTDAARLRMIWGGVAGAKMHELLHGVDFASPKTNRSSPRLERTHKPGPLALDPFRVAVLLREGQKLRAMPAPAQLLRLAWHVLESCPAIAAGGPFVGDLYSRFERHRLGRHPGLGSERRRRRDDTPAPTKRRFCFLARAMVCDVRAFRAVGLSFLVCVILSHGRYTCF